jgi:uncharacterized membrane protein
MKIAANKTLLVALSLAAVTISEAFSPQATLATGLKSKVKSMPLATSLQSSNESDNEEKRKSTDPTPALFKYFKDSNYRNTAVAGAALAAALSFAPLPSDAAMSGGRIGGSSFAPSTSRSYSAPSGGYSRGYSGGYSRGYYSRPGITIAPTMPLIAPISPFTPFYSPYSYGAPGVITYSRGPGLLPFLVLGGLALAVSNAVSSIGRNGGPIDMFQDRQSQSVLGSGTSVVKMSVALDVSNRDDPNSILAVLERLANTANTDSRVGIQNLSSQIALELLRRKSSIISASTEYQHFNNREKAQREFNALSIKERGKFEQETISKFGGVDYSTGRSESSSGFNDKATMAVVTLVLAIDGDSTKVPAIRSLRDVEDALRKIAADVKVSDCLQGAEILWTPEDRSETLTMRDVVADYPELTTV